MRKLQLLPGIEPHPQEWESTTLTTAPIPLTCTLEVKWTLLAKLIERAMKPGFSTGWNTSYKQCSTAWLAHWVTRSNSFRESSWLANKRFIECIWLAHWQNSPGWLVISGQAYRGREWAFTVDGLLAVKPIRKNPLQFVEIYRVKKTYGVSNIKTSENRTVTYAKTKKKTV